MAKMAISDDDGKGINYLGYFQKNHSTFKIKSEE
jgi:hypothetical protein